MFGKARSISLRTIRRSLIREQKSTMIVEAIHYNMTEGKYDSDIFTVKSKMDFDRAGEDSLCEQTFQCYLNYKGEVSSSR